MTTSKRTVSALAVALSAAAFAACTDEPTAPGGAVMPEELQKLSPGIHPVLSIPQLQTARPGELVEIRLHFREIDVDAPVSSYQGELRFDTEALSLQEGEFPEGLLGAWNQIEPGRVRFAGVSLDGLAEGAALTLTVEVLRPLHADDFQLEMEEVVSSKGFSDLTEQVVKRERPLLTDFALVKN